MNVLMGERYKLVPKESHKLAKGEFGQSPKPMDPEVQKKILKGEGPITCRPADLIEPQLPKFEEEMAKWKRQPEDVLTSLCSLQLQRSSLSTGTLRTAA